MPRWSQQDYDNYTRKASRAKPEPTVRDEPVAEAAREEINAGRIRVSITSWRVRLLDPDNLCAKYFVDCLRYAEIIPDDRQRDIALEVQQGLVARKQDERTEIEVTANE